MTLGSPILPDPSFKNFERVALQQAYDDYELITNALRSARHNVEQLFHNGEVTLIVDGKKEFEFSNSRDGYENAVANIKKVYEKDLKESLLLSEDNLEIGQ